MAAQLLDEIVRNGQALPVPATTENGRVICRVPRETTHKLHPYSNAIGREIQLERHDIVEKLAPFLMAKLSRAAAGETLELFSVGGRSLTGGRHRYDECLAGFLKRDLTFEPAPKIDDGTPMRPSSSTKAEPHAAPQSLHASRVNYSRALVRKSPFRRELEKQLRMTRKNRPEKVEQRCF
jgi:hypothetical protein